MIWVGGVQGAGKSTLARRLSRKHDLPLHPIDLWTYDHLARMPPNESLADELERGAQYAADAFRATSRHRLALVLADVRARQLGSVPALVEGPQLTPGLAEPLPKGYGVWLVADPARTRAAREQRLAAVPTPAERARLERLLERDSLLAEYTRREAQRLGLPLIAIPGAPDWAPVQEAVEEAIAPALHDAPRLTATQLGEQRRLENAAAARQGRLWKQAAGLTELPRYAFACECGRGGCTETRRATPDEYDLRASLGLVRAAEHAEGDS